MTMTIRGVERRNTDNDHVHVQRNHHGNDGIEEGELQVHRTHPGRPQQSITNQDGDFYSEEFPSSLSPVEFIDDSTTDASNHMFIASNDTGSNYYYNGNQTMGLLGGNNTLDNTVQTYEYSQSDMILTFLCPIFLFLFCGLCQRGNVPSSEYHRGAMIRRQAERVWAIQRAKKEREAIPLETRKQQIETSLRKMKVVSKCQETGHCILEPEETQSEEDSESSEAEDATETKASNKVGIEGMQTVESSKTPNNGNPEESVEGSEDTCSTASCSSGISPATSPVRPLEYKCESKKACPESPGRAERRPLLSSDSEDSGDTTSSKEEPLPPSPANNISYDFDDDEDVCPICLDNFEVGDSVMWSRQKENGCSHAFHEECLMEWLLTQRENECPTCRACFIEHASSSSEDTETEDESSSEEETVADNSTCDELVDPEDDIEQGNASKSDDAFQTNELMDESSSSPDSVQDEESPEMESADESGCIFMIVKGSVQIVSG